MADEISKAKHFKKPLRMLLNILKYLAHKNPLDEDENNDEGNDASHCVFEESYQI